MASAELKHPQENFMKPRLSEDLNVLLKRLARSKLQIGPREHIAVSTLSMHLLACGACKTLRDFRPHLAPILASSPEERQIYFHVFDSFVPNQREPDIKINLKDEEFSQSPTPKWGIIRIVLFVCVMSALAAWFIYNIGETGQPPSTPGVEEKLSKKPQKRYQKAPVKSENLKIEFKSLERIYEASEAFEYVPTIEELGQELSRLYKEAPPRYYILGLHELTGLPRHMPLDLFGVAKQELKLWVQLALTLERLTNPSQKTNYKEILQQAQKAPKKSLRPFAYQIAKKIHKKYDGEDIPNQNLKAVLKDIRKKLKYKSLDNYTIQRALAIQPDPRNRIIFDNAPWHAPEHSMAVTIVPNWTPAMVALIPLLIAMFWLVNTLMLKKAYLRRRPPIHSPLRHKLVSDAKNRTGDQLDLYRKIARKLQIRSSETTHDINVSNTILETVKSGGVIQPVFETIKRAPEYLVLIERDNMGDQDAMRMRRMVEHLSDLVNFDVYYYQKNPALVRSETGNRYISVDGLMSRHPHHRLIIMGSGQAFLNPGDNRPHKAVEKLTFWDSRALMTPIPLAEWGRRELIIADQLNMPIGRATPEGLYYLTELLGLEGNEQQAVTDIRGDNLSRALPEVLRFHPERFLYETPPSNYPVEHVLMDLRNFLDGPAYEWLCALAVYPSIQWDLTLHLGISINNKIKPVYSEERLGALTQLPWLREGIMPNWLRIALIQSLPKQREKEIRHILYHLINDSNNEANLTIEGPRLEISREDQTLPKDLFKDEVLLDFLSRGREEDLEMGRKSILEKLFPRRWLERFGIPEFSAGLVALAYSVTAFYVTPGHSQEPLGAGALLPLVALIITGLIALGLFNPVQTYNFIRGFFVRSFSFALTLFLSVFSLLLLTKFLGVTLNFNRFWEFSGLTFLVLVFFYYSCFISDRLYIPNYAAVGFSVKNNVVWLLKILSLVLVSWFFYRISLVVSAGDLAFSRFDGVSLGVLAIFVCVSWGLAKYFRTVRA